MRQFETSGFSRALFSASKRSRGCVDLLLVWHCVASSSVALLVRAHTRMPEAVVHASNGTQ
eukprot:5005605-Amphidinium_carterae.1